MMIETVEVQVTDGAGAHGALGLIVPLGLDTEFQRFHGFEAPAGWTVSIVADRETGQRAAMLEPPDAEAKPVLRHHFVRPEAGDPSPALAGGAMPEQAWRPETTPLAHAAASLATEAAAIAAQAGGGRAGIAAIVADTAERFSYADAAPDPWHDGESAVPLVACAAGNCIDINTYLVAALRAAGYATAYVTCYYFDDNPAGIEPGMHCWVRTRCEGIVEDWDIAHFKKAKRADIHAALNPVPGRRFALAYGRAHVYPWRGGEIRVATPSRAMWVGPDGAALWGAPPVVRLV